MAGKKNPLGQTNESVILQSHTSDKLTTIPQSRTSDELATTFQSIDKEKPKHFEKIDSLSKIDESKLVELQQAELVLVYRDNNRYKAMSDELKNLVEKKYWWNVYCVSIPQGTEELNDKEIELLKNILNTCNCMTDNTVGRLTWIHCPKFEDYWENYETSKRFMWIIENLRKSIDEKGIDTVYVYISWITEEGQVCNSYSDHWSMYQREDWSIYFDPYHNWDINEETSIKINDFKRFWKSAFPNSDVNFIEWHYIGRDQIFQIFDFSKYKSEWKIIFKRSGKEIPYDIIEEKIKEAYPNFNIDFYVWNELNDSNWYKSDWAILIADRHVSSYVESFQGQKIFYAWNTFEPNWWIENFVSSEDSQYVRDAAVNNLAESIILNITWKKDIEIRE